MNKHLLAFLAVAFVAVGSSTTSSAQSVVGVDLSKTWIGYMNVFENSGGSKGAYVFGSDWGVNDLKSTLDVGAGSILLQPNFNTYANNPGDAFWRNNGGAGPLGNKWMDANTFTQYGSVFSGTLTFTGAVSAYSLSPDYTATAFIRALDPNAGYATVVESTDVLSATGSFSVGADLSASQPTWIIQTGFQMSGINANPANVVAAGSVTVVPEPSTYALLALGGLGLGAHLLRQRRRQG
jgi:hypothetical protein